MLVDHSESFEMAKGEAEIDHRLIKAIGHPLRMRILAALNERVASPTELAEEFGESLGVVSYHVKILDELGCIELVSETPRRGAVEHHYRAIVRPYFSDSDWSQLPGSVKRSISTSTLTEIWRDVGNALDSGTFDSRNDRHLRWANLTLDDEGWRELGEILTNVYHDALEIQAESLERIAGSGAPDLPTSKLVLMHYEAGAPRRAGKPPAKAAKRRPKKR
jgi:DNA-binding transcriptional ArsR family regulator